MKRQETVADWPEAHIRIKTLQLVGEHAYAVDHGRPDRHQRRTQTDALDQAIKRRITAWRRDVAVAATAVAFGLSGCSTAATSQHMALKGQTVAQKEKDSEECRAVIKQEQGGMIGGNMSAGWGYFWAGGVGVAKAKEAQETYAKCMAERGYKVATE
jgi:Double zinc ribbon